VLVSAFFLDESWKRNQNLVDKLWKMGIFKKDWQIKTTGKGTYEITSAVSDALQSSGLSDGLVSVLVKHTSCSLVLMENADPTARTDLERFMDDLVPDDNPHFIHTYEGPDDMPSHIKMALTRSSENIPFSQGRLQLGTWQGIFLWEHRVAPHNRTLTFTFLGE
jgi:secondary thiamine-phosphate synthase enzyme